MIAINVHGKRNTVTVTRQLLSGSSGISVMLTESVAMNTALSSVRLRRENEHEQDS